MSRVFVYAHYPPHDAEMSVVSDGEVQCSPANRPTVESTVEIFEIEVFKSQVVTIASCGFSEESGIGNVENIRYKSCGDRLPNDNVKANIIRKDTVQEKDVAAPGTAVEHKARRFKRISLQWLLKPSRRTSHNSSRIRRVNGTGKRRITRINSAPKTFGPSGNDFSCVEREKVHILETHSPKEGAQQGSSQAVKRDTRKMRRISLPAHVLDVSGSGMDKHLADLPLPRTPEPRRKNVAEFDEKFIQSLRIKDSYVTSDSKTKQGTIGGESETKNAQVAAVTHHPEGKSSWTREPREAFAQLKNTRKESAASSTSNANSTLASRPVLKLHKFHNPDIFYMPLPDDTPQSPDTLSNKLCRARLIEPRNENYMIQECVKEELQAFLHDKQFCSQSCQRWCLELSQNIKTSVHRMKHFESKIVCVVYIAALRGHGVHAAAQCILTPNDDNFITVNFKNRSLIAVASVLAIKYA